MKIAIASDLSGFPLKEAIVKHLKEKNYEIIDFGIPNESEPKPYFIQAPKVAQAIQKGEVERGILVCGTGQGMAIVANKFKGVYAVCCESTYTAEKCRAINNANVLTFGAFIVGEKKGYDMCKVFLTTNLGDNLEEFRTNNVKKAFPVVQELEASFFKQTS